MNRWPPRHQQRPFFRPRGNFLEQPPNRFGSPQFNRAPFNDVHGFNSRHSPPPPSFNSPNRGPPPPLNATTQSSGPRPSFPIPPSISLCPPFCPPVFNSRPECPPMSGSSTLGKEADLEDKMTAFLNRITGDKPADRRIGNARRRSRSPNQSREDRSYTPRRPASPSRRRSRSPNSRPSASSRQSSSNVRHGSPHRRDRRASSRESGYQGSRAGSRERNDKRMSVESNRFQNRHSEARSVRRDDRSRSPSMKRRRRRSRTPEKINSDEGGSSEDEESEDEPKEDEIKDEEYTVRCAPANLYYQPSDEDPAVFVATPKLLSLHNRFEHEILERSTRHRLAKFPNEPPKGATPNLPKRTCFHDHLDDISSSSSNFSSDEEEEKGGEDEDKESESSFLSSSDNDDNKSEKSEQKKKQHIKGKFRLGIPKRQMDELEAKRSRLGRLHSELWHNEKGQMNDGPVCRCSYNARKSGIRHSVFPGEKKIEACDPLSNNIKRLYHYRITMAPYTNFLTPNPTVIKHDGNEYIFEGFSMFSHEKFQQFPTCKIIRFNIEYTILYIEEANCPTSFVVKDLDLFYQFLFVEIMELLDLDWRTGQGHTGCPTVHFMPRFTRIIKQDKIKEILPMNEVLHYFLKSSELIVEKDQLRRINKSNQFEWQKFSDNIINSIVTYPGVNPSAVRVDQVDRGKTSESYPEIVHFGIRPLILSYAGNPEYQRAWREFVKYKHLLANKPKVFESHRRLLEEKEESLLAFRQQGNMKRDVTIEISTENFYTTGIRCDMVQHALLLPILLVHLRFHCSLHVLEEELGYQFKSRDLIQLALTHPSYRENFGVNPDHVRNTITNCGIRQPQYGDRRIHYRNVRKRGINVLIDIMSRLGQKDESKSDIQHNERLEFLGDAVVEFISSIHLYHLFPNIEEGGLATYRAAIVQNQHLAVMAKRLGLHRFILYAHGSDLCGDDELRHAMANCFEAVMGALFIDGGIEIADRIFGRTLFPERELLHIWHDYPLHPIQAQYPDSDRHLIPTVPLLQKLTSFELSVGIEFTHIRLLARAFTHRSVGQNNLTLGSNQRMEFLGDTVLQLITSEYLYKHFPGHHEGHLSLLRSSLVNNRNQAKVCDDLGMCEYAIFNHKKPESKSKDKADFLEAFIGALYVDKGLEYCKTFCNVCFFPRLTQFIISQDWNDPKSKLQQCCLTLRELKGEEPDIPVYKVIECIGPTNTRVFTVAVYFRGKRLGTGSGHSIQQAEMKAAAEALRTKNTKFFPQLYHQRKVILEKYPFMKILEPKSINRERGKSRNRSISKSPAVKTKSEND